MTYEMFQQGPSVYVPYILISLAITLAAYGAFPLIFARVRSRVITRKKYRVYCFGFNLLVMITFCIIYGRFSSWAPYLIWTTVFSGMGIRTLINKGALSAPKHFASAQSPLEIASSEPSEFSASTENTQDLFNSVENEPVFEPPHTEGYAPASRQAYASYENTRPKNRKSVATLVIISVFLTASLAVNVLQYLQSSPMATEIEELQESVDSLNSAIEVKNTTISSLSKKANLYDFICMELSSGDYGYAANNFNASESVIVLRKNEAGRKFTLTANWTSGGTVQYYRSGTSADISFDSNSWQTSTTMTVLPLTEGITKFTFRNNIDANEFKVMIIVTD